MIKPSDAKPTYNISIDNYERFNLISSVKEYIYNVKNDNNLDDDYKFYLLTNYNDLLTKLKNTKPNK